jgi:hypothetical protein
MHGDRKYATSKCLTDYSFQNARRAVAEAVITMAVRRERAAASIVIFVLPKSGLES